MQGGETNATNQPTQTVVVVQQAQTVPEDGVRYPRWAYLVFSIGLGAWSFFCIIGGLTTAAVHMMFFLGLFIPSLLTFIFLIIDATVHCANPGSAAPTKICCCECMNPMAFIVPMGVAIGLRLIFWIWVASSALSELDASDDEFNLADNVIWMLLSVGSFDAGPMILCGIDWWVYYKMQDYEGIFGTKNNPLRPAVAGSILTMIISWSFVAIFEDGADDLIEFIWPWIVHGLVSTAIVLLAAALNFSGAIKGPNVSSEIWRYVCLGAGVAQACVILIITIKMFGLFEHIDDTLGLILFLIFIAYYFAITVPAAWGLLSIKTAAPNANNGV